MRKDMFKVIVERGRAGGHGSRRGRPPREIDDGPRQEGLRRQHSDHKELNETLAPLRRFIEGCEGRPWNKVYSELRENIKPGNTVQEHVLAHVDQYIKRHVEFVDPDVDNPCGVREKAGRRYAWNRGLAAGELYVDPNDGIVKRARLKIALERQPRWSDNNKLLAPRLFGARINGLWYGFPLVGYHVETRMERVQLDDGSYKSKRTVEFVFGTERLTTVLEQHRGLTLHADDSIQLNQLSKLYGGRLIAKVPKRQLNGEELKRYNLRNDHVEA